MAIPAVGVAVAGQLALTGAAAAAPAAPATSGAAGPVATVRNLLDCNLTVLQRLCTDPHGKNYAGSMWRFRDPKTGAYVGHDEPSVKFISSRRGSGNTMTYGMQLSTDPAAAATAGGSVTKYGELSVAPWFGLPICDPKSYPQHSCRPLSDSNSGLISDPNAAGSAFMELQFYPPGFTPFVDAASCSTTQWCAALNIDSLECTFNFGSCNGNCIEPVNYAFLQTNGVPAGPPAPQNTTLATLTGNSHTLKMNPGDVLKVSISNVPDRRGSRGLDTGGIKTVVTDETTHQAGYMVASAANGFQNTSMADCSGTPYSFHAEYSTARQANQVPWAALEGGVLMEQEIGHGESCAAVTSKLSLAATFADGSTYTDPNVYQSCGGGSEGPGNAGEGPCSPATGACANATTQGPAGPVACPVNNAATGALCEFSDGFCFRNGSRPATVNGHPVTESSLATLCYQDAFQNGDLDFDGNSYLADWPDGTSRHPATIRYAGPFTYGHSYPSIQFETDVAGSENLCNVATGLGCTAPPISAAFYPFWTLNNTQTLGRLVPHAGACVWNFGNVIRGVTRRTFGKDAQYGTPDVARYGGTIASTVRGNPALGRSCRRISF